jgi:hypothetical protein
MLFLVGAGVSVARPAELPLFDPIRQRLVDQLGLCLLPPDVVAAAGGLAPEVFMRVLYQGGLPLEAWLAATLGRGSPNALHWALAAALQLGASVWTVKCR